MLRLLLAVTLACWMPLCMCRTAGAAEVASACCSKRTERACCQSEDKQSGKPCKHDGSCACSKRASYVGPQVDQFTPELPVLLQVLTWPPAYMRVLAPAEFSPPSVAAVAPPMPPTSLLRQHCALVV
ncbi:MAG TPA: hypothetical protein VD997_01875 [Phycisphaerales bacterium]|nr:hypothetical protein [Phycisphaerales bacterium]